MSAARSSARLNGLNSHLYPQVGFFQKSAVCLRREAALISFPLGDWHLHSIWISQSDQGRSQKSSRQGKRGKSLKSVLLCSTWGLGSWQATEAHTSDLLDISALEIPNCLSPCAGWVFLAGFLQLLCIMKLLYLLHDSVGSSLRENLTAIPDCLCLRLGHKRSVWRKLNLKKCAGFLLYPHCLLYLRDRMAA